MVSYLVVLTVFLLILAVISFYRFNRIEEKVDYNYAQITNLMLSLMPEDKRTEDMKLKHEIVKRYLKSRQVKLRYSDEKFKDGVDLNE